MARLLVVHYLDGTKAYVMEGGLLRKGSTQADVYAYEDREAKWCKVTDGYSDAPGRRSKD